MEDMRTVLTDAIRALRDAEALVLARTTIAAAERFLAASFVDELAELRQAAGDLHRAVATLVEGQAGHGN